MIKTREWQSFVAATAGLLLTLHAAAKHPAALPDGWTKYDNLAPVIGADGNPHSATCSAFPGTDPSFSFWARTGTAKDLVVFFEGGGACWDSLTCNYPQPFYVPAIAPTTDPSNSDGIFNFSNPANPVRDWSFVYIPYCTGDLHLGSADTVYFNVGEQPGLPPNPLPPAVTTFMIHHRGFDNFMVVLDWIEKNFDKPKNILVAGSSAGGYGASANFPWIQEAFPNSHMYVIADASQGVTTDTWDVANPGRESWNPVLAPWVYGDDPSLVPSADLLRIAADAYPHAKVSQFTTAFDGTQIPFYGLMKQFYPPGGSCPNVALDWNQQMLATLSSYASEIGNYRLYVAGGSYHTIFHSPGFYTENSPGIVYSQWVDAMLQDRGGTNGHGGGAWQDVACPTCLISPPCP